MNNFKKAYAVILLKGVQKEITIGSILKINNLSIKNFNIFILNNVLLIYVNNTYYFRDNVILNRTFILCRIISNDIIKKSVILKFKRRKHHFKKKRTKSVSKEVIVEKFVLNFN